MTTIKLSKTPTNTVATGKTPVRRAGAAVRDRTKAPPKPVIRDTENSPNAEKPKMDSRLRGND
ncbi:MAG TPA: pseudouridine synthase, partial [Methylotenera sp.]|nr:pseudouridine synthase [Methylotenera sp.]